MFHLTWVIFLLLFSWCGKTSFSCFIYCKVASSKLCWFVAHLRIFRLLMKGKFDAYVLWPLSTRVQNWTVDGSSACNFTVFSLFTFRLASCVGPKKQGLCPKINFSQMKICYRISLNSILSWIISPWNSFPSFYKFST